MIVETLLIIPVAAPIQCAFEHSYYDQAVGFMRVFLTGALKTNPSLDFAVLTGVLRVAKESIFSDLNNLRVSTLLNALYPDVMGFTGAEVAEIAEAYGVSGKMPEIRKWYDGYRVGDAELYNPWSVVNYFASGCQPRFYWLNTSGNGIIKEMVAHADARTIEKLRKVLGGVPIRAMLREGIIYADIYDDKDALYTMLVTTGYLTMKDAVPTDFGLDASLVIPNREIMSVYRNEIVGRFQKGVQISDLRILMQAFLDGDARRCRMASVSISRFSRVRSTRLRGSRSITALSSA